MSESWKCFRVVCFFRDGSAKHRNEKWNRELWGVNAFPPLSFQRERERASARSGRVSHAHTFVVPSDSLRWFLPKKFSSCFYVIDGVRRTASHSKDKHWHGEGGKAKSEGKKGLKACTNFAKWNLISWDFPAEMFMTVWSGHVDWITQFSPRKTREKVPHRHDNLETRSFQRVEFFSSSLSREWWNVTHIFSDPPGLWRCWRVCLLWETKETSRNCVVWMVMLPFYDASQKGESGNVFPSFVRWVFLEKVLSDDSPKCYAFTFWVSRVVIKFIARSRLLIGIVMGKTRVDFIPWSNPVKCNCRVRRKLRCIAEGCALLSTTLNPHLKCRKTFSIKKICLFLLALLSQLSFD